MRSPALVAIVLLTPAALAMPSACAAPKAAATDADEFQDQFGESVADFASRGSNPYFVLEPGTVLEYEGVEDGQRHRLTITVLDETREVAGVTTRVVEERETEGDELAEVSRNYFAISKRTNAVYYFGEDVDVYQHGRVVSHEGAWHAGVDGARYGMAMPAAPKTGQRWYQEVAPGVAMDRAAVVKLDLNLPTPAGTFDPVLVTEETTPLEPRSKERKYYAKGVGLVRDGDLRLVAIHGPGAKR
jgi:hypothetical protein